MKFQLHVSNTCYLGNHSTFSRFNSIMNFTKRFTGKSKCHITRYYSSKSSSSTRWLRRQKSDIYTAEARVQGLMSRAAFKLIELDKKHHLFKPGMTVVDLGFAPGSWSQVAIEKTHPKGFVVGVDILPCRPPRGMSSIQGNFLSVAVQQELKAILEHNLRRPLLKKHIFADEKPEEKVEDLPEGDSYLNRERHDSSKDEYESANLKDFPLGSEYYVDLVLSDMCEPWPQINGFWLRTINDPYIRMMNTSGNALRDHRLSIVSAKRKK